MDTARFAAPVIRRHLPDPAYRVLLFRSRATCSARERSDIDIGIEESPAPVSRAALAAIHDELEEAPTLYTIEVVDFARTFRRDFAGSQNSRSCCDKSPIAAGGFRGGGGPRRRGSRPAQRPGRTRSSGSRFHSSYAGSSSRRTSSLRVCCPSTEGPLIYINDSRYPVRFMSSHRTALEALAINWEDASERTSPLVRQDVQFAGGLMNYVVGVVHAVPLARWCRTL